MYVFAGWWIAIVLRLLRLTCRYHWHNDQRPRLRAAGTPYLYAIAHCHQVGAVIGAEPGTCAMLSRSQDGDLLAPALIANGVIPVRGSSHKGGKDKGGRAALDQLVAHVQAGHPAYLAVDGPRGPRNHVKMGVALLAQATGATVLTAIPIPKRRWILTGTWDRMQFPQPFTRIDAHFGEALTLEPGEDLDAFRLRVENALIALEERLDPAEAALGKISAQKRRDRNAAANEPPTDSTSADETSSAKASPGPN